MDLNKLEMIRCPRCGQLFPKKRQELGYNYCINCSTEKRVTYIIEGTTDGDGDDTIHSAMYIISQEEADKINRATGIIQESTETEDMYGIPDMRTTEDRDTADNVESDYLSAEDISAEEEQYW